MDDGFIVTFTTEAKAAITEQAKSEGFARPGVTIHRQGPRGDLNRTSDGKAVWTVERPHSWRAQVVDFNDFGKDPIDVSTFDGVLVWLALIPKQGEVGVRVLLRGEALFVEPLPPKDTE